MSLVVSGLMVGVLVANWVILVSEFGKMDIHFIVASIIALEPIHMAR